MSFINITPTDHPQVLTPKFPGDVWEAWQSQSRGTVQGQAPLGHQRAPGGPQLPESRAMAAARVLLLLSGRPESVSFAQSVCGLLGARSGLGPWPMHCSLKQGRLVLSARPFPGASFRLPLQVGKRGNLAWVQKGRRRGLGSGGNWRREA